jgi:hypothetical protein
MKNALTEEKRSQLKQFTRVAYKSSPNQERIYESRIEVHPRSGELYLVAEENYRHGNCLPSDYIRYANPLDCVRNNGYFYFEIIGQSEEYNDFENLISEIAKREEYFPHEKNFVVLTEYSPALYQLALLMEDNRKNKATT